MMTTLSILSLYQIKIQNSKTPKLKASYKLKIENLILIICLEVWLLGCLEFSCVSSTLPGMTAERTKVTTIGGGGMIGSEIASHLQGVADVFIPAHSNLDITNQEQVDKYMSLLGGDVVILAAGYTDVNGAQKEVGKVIVNNLQGTKNVAEACKKHGKFMVYLSTDMVFPEGRPGVAFRETDKIGNIDSPNTGIYAVSKIGAEVHIGNMKDFKPAIVRFGYPFGSMTSDRDYVRKMIVGLRANRPMFDDQHITLTYIPDLVAAVARIVRFKTPGIFHVSCNQLVTPFEVAGKVAKAMNFKGEPRSGKLDTYLAEPGVAPRHHNGGLNSELTQSMLGIKFHKLDDAIAEFISDLSST